jgi:hypothetical protein
MLCPTKFDCIFFNSLVNIPDEFNCIGGVMVSVLASSEVDRGFIGGVMVSVLTSSEVDV